MGTSCEYESCAFDSISCIVHRGVARNDIQRHRTKGDPMLEVTLAAGEATLKAACYREV